MAILFEIPGVDVKISFHVATQESSARVLKKYLSNFGHRVWICVDDSAAGSSKRHTTAGAGSASILLMNPEWLNSLECEMERKMIIQRVTKDKNLAPILILFPNLDARHEILTVLQAFASTIIHVKNTLITDKDSDILQDILKAVNNTAQGGSASNKQNVPLLTDHKPASECDKCKSPALSHYCPECAIQFCEACGTSYHSKGARVKHKMKLLEKCQDCENALAELSCAICELLYCGDCSNFAHSRKSHSVVHFMIPGMRDHDVSDGDKSSISGSAELGPVYPEKDLTPVCEKNKCTSQLPPALYCAQCKKIYCEPCSSVFHSKGTRSSHDLKPLEKCDDCASAASLSCVECDVLYCIPCSADAHAHLSHTILPIVRGISPSPKGKSSDYRDRPTSTPPPTPTVIQTETKNDAEKGFEIEGGKERGKQQRLENRGNEKEIDQEIVQGSVKIDGVFDQHVPISGENQVLKAGGDIQEIAEGRDCKEQDREITNVMAAVSEKMVLETPQHQDMSQGKEQSDAKPTGEDGKDDSCEIKAACDRQELGDSQDQQRSATGSGKKKRKKKRKGHCPILTAAIIRKLDQRVAYPDVPGKHETIDGLPLPQGEHMTCEQACLYLIQNRDPKVRALGYDSLGNAIQNIHPPVTTLPDGRNITRQQLHLEAIRVDPECHYAYGNCSLTVKGRASLTLPDGRVMNKKQLAMEAIRLNPNQSYGYYCLSKLIRKIMNPQDQTRFTLPDGRVLTAIYIGAQAYMLDCNAPDLDLERSKQMCLDTMKTVPDISYYCYLYLSTILRDDETVTLPDGRIMGKTELLLEALKLDPENAAILNALSAPLIDGKTVTLCDGRVMNTKQVLTEVIRFNGQQYESYYLLARTLSANETVILHDGRIMRKKDLLLEGVKRVHPTTSGARRDVVFPNDIMPLPRLDYRSAMYNDLGRILQRHETVTLRDGQVVEKKHLFMQAIRLDSSYSPPYSNLGLELPAGEATVTLHDGRVMDRRLLFLEAIRLDPQSKDAYFNLANVKSGPNENIQLPDGRVMNSIQVMLEYIRLGGTNCHAYYHIAVMLTAGGTVTLPNGREMTKRLLYLEAIKLNNQYSQAYNNLSRELNQDEAIELSDGRMMNKRQLLLQAIKWDSTNCNALLHFASCLREDEEVVLEDGRAMTKQALQAEASRIHEEASKTPTDPFVRVPDI